MASDGAVVAIPRDVIGSLSRARSFVGPAAACAAGAVILLCAKKKGSDLTPAMRALRAIYSVVMCALAGSDRDPGSTSCGSGLSLPSRPAREMAPAPVARVPA